MNVKQLSQAIGHTVLVDTGMGDIRVHAIVKDVRKVWNRIDLLVAPESGKGEAWVSLERVCSVRGGALTGTELATV